MPGPSNPYGQPAPGWQPRQPGEPAGYERPPDYGQGQYTQPQPQPGGYNRQQGNGYGPPMPPQQQPRRKKHTGRNVFLSLLGLAVVIIAIGAALSSGSKGAPAAAASSSPAAAASPAAAPAGAPRVIATFTGSGIENTARFNAPKDYILKWSYNCAAFGETGNFVVSGDGGSDFNGASVNELGNGGHGQTHVYDDAGSHYLGIDSECSWTAQVVG